MTEAYHFNALPPGTTLQEYEVLRVLGAGSFGIVYLAKGKFLDDVVAIKEYLPRELAMRAEGSSVTPTSSADEDNFQWGRQKFLEEARLLWQLAKPQPHPNIIAVRRFFELHGTAYMVMDYEQGEPLSARLESAGRLADGEVWPLLHPLLNGLETIHEAGITHRDIKPGNIFVRADGSPVLLDFGAARLALGERTQSAFNAMSPAYAATEQLIGSDKVGPWSDIYGLGATFYRAVTGRLPQPPLERLVEERHRSAVDLAGDRYGRSLLEGIDAALALRAEDRPQSIAQWRAILLGRPGEFEEDTAIVPKAVGGPEPTRPPAPSPVGGAPGPGTGRGRRPVLVAAALVLLIAAAAIGLGAYYLTGQPEEGGRKAEGELAEAESPAGQAPLSPNETVQREEEARRLAELEAKLRAETEAKRAAEAEARRLAEREAGRRAEEERRRLAQEEARRRAEEEAKRVAEAKAERLAEEARRKTELEARWRAELEAKVSAEAEAKRKAEAEAQRLAELEARKAAEAEARRKAEEARKLAEAETERLAEEARRKAELEARWRAELEAELKAEAEARRLAEEEARRLAEQARLSETEEEVRKPSRIEAFERVLYAAKNTNVRAEPTTESGTLTTVAAGAGLQVTGKLEDGKWYRVSLADGTPGFVWAALLAAEPPPATAQRAAESGPADPDSLAAGDIEPEQAVGKVHDPSGGAKPEAAPSASGGDKQPPQTARLTPSATSPVRSRAEVEAYLEDNKWKLRDQLSAYNKTHRLVVPITGRTDVEGIQFQRIVELRGDTVVLEVELTTGHIHIRTTGTFRFEFKWIGGDLKLIGHAEVPVQTALLAPSGEPPARSRAEVEAYFEDNKWKLRDQLSAYNKAHRLVVPITGKTDVEGIQLQRIVELRGDTVVLEVELMTGHIHIRTTGTFRFEFKWIDGDLKLVGHAEVPVQTALLAPSGEPPVKSLDQVRAYLDQNQGEFQRKLDQYNEDQRILVSQTHSTKVMRIYSQKIEELYGETVVLQVRFQVGSEARAVSSSAGCGVFELKWIGDELEFVGHRENCT